MEGAAGGFRLGLQWHHLPQTQQNDVLSLLQWLPFSVWATGGIAPVLHLPLVLGLYALTRSAIALQGVYMAVCGLYAGSIAGFASGVANSLLNSMHVISGVARVTSGAMQGLLQWVVRMALRLVS